VSCVFACKRMHTSVCECMHGLVKRNYTILFLVYVMLCSDWLLWSRGSVLAFSTQVCGFKPGRSRWIFRAKKSSARLPSEGK